MCNLLTKVTTTDLRDHVISVNAVVLITTSNKQVLYTVLEDFHWTLNSKLRVSGC